MTVEDAEEITKTFKFSYPTCTNDNVLFNLEVPVTIPHDGCTRELVQRVIDMFHIPVYLEDELNEKLAEFVKDETKNWHNERDAKLIDQFKTNEIDIDGVIKNWEKLFKDNVVEYAEQKGISDEEVFAAAYHKLVHSPALETILQVESSYASAVYECMKRRDEDIKSLTQRQTEEMEQKVSELNITSTEQDINDLAAQQFEEQSVCAARWGSQLDALSAKQRASYRGWLLDTLQQYQGSGISTPSTPVPLPPMRGPAPLCDTATVHLGSQLKHTHNITIMAADIRDFCAADQGHSPSRLQCALSLYSVGLSGLVVLSERPPAPSPRPATEDYHFDSLDVQLANIAELLHEPTERRNAQRLKEQTENPGSNPGPRIKSRKNMQPGDVYITKHSNLSEAHVIFHLIVDDSLKSGEITSRHPVILGLRNVLKASCCNDVTTLTLPLLLTHELTDVMTSSWCHRRAELVLKCVKGFMLETASWGGAPLQVVQLVLPAGLAEGVFRSLAALLPAVFRAPTPLKIKPTS